MLAGDDMEDDGEIGDMAPVLDSVLTTGSGGDTAATEVTGAWLLCM